MYRLEITDSARLDFLEANIWYETQRIGLGADLELQIEASLGLISRNPLAFQLKYKNVRVCFIKRFPYGIHFVVDEKTIKIIAFFHTSRSPRRWGMNL
jgi:toxin ParE1/3/4